MEQFKKTDDCQLKTANCELTRVRDCRGKPTARRRRCEDLQRKARPFMGNAQIT